MTETEWLTCDDPTPMLEYLEGQASDRKLRLFACVCARRAWLCTREGLVQEVVELSEQFTEGETTKEELEAVRSQLGARGGYSAAWAANNALHAVLEDEAGAAARRAIRHAVDFRYFFTIEEKTAITDKPGAAAGAREVERRELADVVREFFGNPFGSIVVDPSWQSWNAGTVPKLAQTIYADRAFDNLPILADALEEAGCNDASILEHCRGPGPHVRDCWAVDLLLAKK